MGNGGRDLGLLKRLKHAAGLSALATATLGSGPCGSCPESFDDCSSIEELKMMRDSGLAMSAGGSSFGPGTPAMQASSWDGMSCPTVEQRKAIARLNGEYWDGYVEPRPAQADDRCCYHISPDCPGGRPFLVDGRARVAVLSEPTAARASALARAWLGDAMAEHASVASFARLSWK